MTRAVHVQHTEGRGARVRGVIATLRERIAPSLSTNAAVVDAVFAEPTRKFYPRDPLTLVQTLTRQTRWPDIARALRCHEPHLFGACAVLTRFTAHEIGSSLSADAWYRAMSQALDAMRNNPQEWEYR